MSIREGYKQTDTEEIPEEWAIRKLGDERVARLMKAGGTPLRTRKEYYENGNIPFVRIEDITTAGKYLNKTELKITEKGLNNSSTWLVPKKSILYSMYASYGEAVINTIPVATNQAIIAILRSENVDLEYLYYSLNQIKTSLYKYLRTTTQKNLNAKIVKNLKIPIPPLVEQRKIARILSCVDEAIQKTDEVLEKAEMLKRGLMQRLLTRGVGHTEFKETKVGKIPAEWEAVRIKNVTLEHKQGFYTNQPYSQTGVKLVRISDLLSPELSYKTMPHLNVDDKIFCQFKVYRGDFLIARSGAIGTYGIVTEDTPAIFGSYIIRFRLDSSRIDNRFFGYFYESDFAAGQLLRIRQGATNININAYNIKTMKIPLPPLSEQRKITSILSAVDMKRDYERRNKDRLVELKKGLMQVLLTGEVRVKVA